METEEDARFILSQAKHCAYGDECSIDDANILLDEMLHLQSGCADLYEEQHVAADIVAHLRVKSTRTRGVVIPKDASVAISSWAATADMTLICGMLLVSTFLTLQVPHDEIVTRIGWVLQNWETVLEPKDNIPLLLFAAAPYISLSEFVTELAASSSRK